MTEIKPVKAWAVVDEIGINPEAILAAKDVAQKEADETRRLFGGEHRVIPVTIVPGHGGENE